MGQHPPSSQLPCAGSTTCLPDVDQGCGMRKVEFRIRVYAVRDRNTYPEPTPDRSIRTSGIVPTGISGYGDSLPGSVPSPLLPVYGYGLFAEADGALAIERKDGYCARLMIERAVQSLATCPAIGR